MALDEGAGQDSGGCPPSRACRHLPEPCFQRKAIAAHYLIHLERWEIVTIICKSKIDLSRHEGCAGDATMETQVNAIDGEVAFHKREDISLKKVVSKVNRSWAAGCALICYTTATLAVTQLVMLTVLGDQPLSTCLVNEAFGADIYSTAKLLF